MGEKYILRKNGEIIAKGDSWKDMRSKIPKSHHGHEHEKYDYVFMINEGDKIEIYTGKDVYNSFAVFYKELNGGEKNKVEIKKEDLEYLLNSFRNKNHI